MTHRLNLFLLILGLLVCGPFYWLLLENPSRNIAPHRLDIAQLRRLADSIPGPRPEAIEVAHIGWKRLPGNFYAAGSGMKRRSFAVLAFRLVVPGGPAVVVETGSSARIGAAMDLEGFVPARQAMVDRWLGEAGVILATSERPQHIGGLATYAATAGTAMALTHARLNPAQIPGGAAAQALGWPDSLVLRAGLQGRRPQAVAPGVVVVPTGVPTPGSQLVYTRLVGGREYVFTGDLAPLGQNYAQLRVRSNLLDRGLPQAERREAMRWLLALRRLHETAPGLTVVPGHDFDWVVDPRQNAGIVVAEPSDPRHVLSGK